MSEDDQFRLPGDCHTCIQELFTYWQSLKSGAANPVRAQFDPLGLSARCWSGLWMLDVAHDPLRFRMRLVGTEIVRFYGSDLTGQWLDEAIPGFAATDDFEILRQCVEAAAPSFVKADIAHASIDWRKPVPENQVLLFSAESLCLPFATDGERVDVLLIMTRFANRQRNQGRRNF